MAAYQLRSDDGRTLGFDIGPNGEIVNLECELLEGEEVRFAGPLPAHVDAVGASAAAEQYGAARGWRVCSHDPRGCRTCYCDDNGDIHCVGIC